MAAPIAVSLQGLTDNIINISGGFIASDDERLHPEQIEFWIHQYREQLMMQFTDYGKDIHSELWQDMGVFKLTKVDTSEDPNLPYGTFVKKLPIPLPRLVTFPNQRGIWVGNINKTTGFVPTTPDNISHKVLNKRANGYKVKWFYIIGQSLYVVSCEDIDYINLRVIAADPSTIGYYHQDGSIRVYDEVADEYPVPSQMRSTITEAILSKELRIGMVTNNDELNNDRDDTGLKAK